MAYLSICAIVKDENSYLPEWIEYHKLVGVERFYIYDNGSRIPLSQTLALDIEEGTVFVKNFPGVGVQNHAYHDCCIHHRADSWIGFIDVDEFVVPNASDNLATLLKDYENHAGIAINWQMFGSSGHQTRPPGLQIENFILKGPVNYEWNCHIKTFAKPFHVTGFPNCHFASYAGGHAFSLARTYVPGPFAFDYRVDKAQINHYFTRSRAEFEEKIARSSADGTRKDISFFNKIDKECSSVKDECILRFVPALRKAIEIREQKERAHGTPGTQKQLPLPA